LKGDQQPDVRDFCICSAEKSREQAFGHWHLEVVEARQREQGRKQELQTDGEERSHRSWDPAKGKNTLRARCEVC